MVIHHGMTLGIIHHIVSDGMTLGTTDRITHHGIIHLGDGVGEVIGDLATGMEVIMEAIGDIIITTIQDHRIAIAIRDVQEVVHIQEGLHTIAHPDVQAIPALDHQVLPLVQVQDLLG